MNQWEWELLEDRSLPDSVVVDGVELKKGQRVRLQPRNGGDIFDLALAGQIAIIESLEQDYEGKIHVAVVLEDDPGKDLGILRQPGHRFFFMPGEVEPLRQAARILIGGIGNIFEGDDGFGVEVIRHLPHFPENVTVKDFGIRGYDLAYALLDGYDLVILVDAAPRGEAPGTLFVLEPHIESTTSAPQPALDAHAMNPLSVLHLAKSMGTISGRILLVGCEPARLGGDEGAVGLSDEVGRAVDGAVRLIETLVVECLSGPGAAGATTNFIRKEEPVNGIDTRE